MDDLTVRDLIDLVQAQAADPNGHIDKIFEWYVERQKLLAQLALGASGSLALVLLAAHATADLSLTSPQLVIFSLGVAASALYGLVVLYRMRRVPREVIAAVRLTAQLGRTRLFISKYR